MKLTAILLASMLTTQASPPPDTTLPLTTEQVAMCEAEGGCALVTRMAVDQLVTRAYAAGVTQGQGACLKPTGSRL